MHELHTTRSWEFLGLEGNGIAPKDSSWELARYGEGTIIGNLDTGIYRFHMIYRRKPLESFSMTVVS